MSFSQRPKSVLEISERILQGSDAGYEVKDFLHAFKFSGTIRMLDQSPVQLEGKLPKGRFYDAFLQALSVFLAAIRNYLLISSPSPFRMRNLFLDEDSLTVV